MDLVHKKNCDFNMKVFSNGGVFILPNFRQSLFDVWLLKINKIFEQSSRDARKPIAFTV